MHDYVKSTFISLYCCSVYVLWCILVFTALYYNLAIFLISKLPAEVDVEVLNVELSI